MPKIYMGDGITTTIKKFKNNQREGISFLLVDLDTEEENIAERLNELDLTEHAENVFWMIQEMEAWFLSQPELIDKLYGQSVAKRLTQKRAQLFEKPSRELMRITRGTPKGEYHKVRDAVDFLERLDAQRLRKDFPQFDELVTKLGG